MVTWTKVVYILLHAVAYKTTLVVYTYKIKGLASISNPHVIQAKMPFLFSGLTATLFSGLIATPFFILEETHPSCVGLVCCMYWNGVLYVLDWCVVCTGLVWCMYWTGVLYVLDWCVVCTGLVCCMYWTGHTSPIHQPSTYTSPVQHTSPIHNTLYVLCCMYSIGMLYEGEDRGWGIAPAPLVKRKGGGEIQ